MHAHELERPLREYRPRSLWLELPLLHEPGTECGPGERGGKDGYENDPHELGDPTSRVAEDLLARKENRCSSVESLQA